MATARTFLAIGALSALAAVAAGAFGAHALRDRLDGSLLAAFETGVRYQMYHALALLAVAWVLDRWGNGLVAWSGWLFVVGTVLFSGSLYLLALTGQRTLGVITPVGGVAFLAGWLIFLIGVLRMP